MSEVRGKLLTCDRCGATCFLKTIGDGVTDGGYTKWNKFEDTPEGWRCIDRNVGQLCPKCNAEYEELITRFMEKEKTEIVRFEDTL
jgi:hypothetical protein